MDFGSWKAVSFIVPHRQTVQRDGIDQTNNANKISAGNLEYHMFFMFYTEYRN